MKTGRTIDSKGIVRWHSNGVLHREDGPAIESPNGDKSWFLNGEVQKVMWNDGTTFFYKNGVYHKEDGPAIFGPTWHSSWYLNGKFLNEDEEKIFEHLQTCSKKELLEWTGTIFTPIIERRMREES